MDNLQLHQKQLPPVQIYAVGPQEAAYVAPLLTAEAAGLIRADEAFGLAVVEGETARGALCARLSPDNDLCMELLSLYVAPQHRRHRLGGTLLFALIEACGEIFDGTIARIEASFLPGQGLEALLQKAGFRLTSDETDACSCFIPVSELTDSPLMKQEYICPGGCTLAPFEKLSRIQIRRLYQTLERANADYMDLNQLYEALPDVSFLLLDAKGQPMACAAFTGDAGRLCLSQFFAAGNSPVHAVTVLRAAADALLDRHPSAQLELPLLAPSAAGLAKRLLGDAGTRKPLIHAVLEL